MPIAQARALPEHQANAQRPARGPQDDACALHVGLIMDGNGRWAQARGLPRIAGHQHGVDALRRSVEAAPGLGIRHLTVYGFSSENWRRPPQEIQHLMGLLRLYLRREVGALRDAGVRLRVIGEREKLAADLRGLIEQAEAATLGGRRLDLTVALSYGGRQELLSAVRWLAEAAAAGQLGPEEIDEARFGAALELAALPDPQIIIRTSGERRLSNFLLWQAVHSELVFLDCFWPDFGEAQLGAVIDAYRRRHAAAPPDRAQAV